MKLRYMPLAVAVLLTGTLYFEGYLFASASDQDNDGLSDMAETEIYKTDPTNPDTDGDATADGKEVAEKTDPAKKEFSAVSLAEQPDMTSLPVSGGPKRIDVDLSEQRLRLYAGGEVVIETLISSGLPRTPTPIGTFSVQKKKPVVHYRGPGYNLPNTKWNLQFLPGYYVHGAYWHNNFGHPMSHGCVNVSYENMEKIYELAEVGTPVVIHN